MVTKTECLICKVFSGPSLANLGTGLLPIICEKFKGKFVGAVPWLIRSRACLSLLTIAS
jgi:hypothetical protein